MQLMADKSAAKRVAFQAGVPVAPGYDGDDQSDDRLIHEALGLGFPLMIKAALGGGGKGMHAVNGEEALPAALAQSRREAEAAFGDSRLLLERRIERPRHVEVQILGDLHGNLIAIGERECSIQRRHQKVVEECPSPAVAPELRERLLTYALAIARAAGYSNAGTVEFLLDQNGNAYFLEMNTRLQVEHAVTEAVYGVDLVRSQIEIAAGAPLQLEQAELRPRGHAIECRIYAEDPQSGFLPATGPVLVFQLPSGPGVRNDAGTFAGDDIGTYYDPLLAKLTVHARDRASAVERMQAALTKYAVLGLTTNLDFLQRLTCHPVFASGAFDVEFLERNPGLASARSPLPVEGLFAVAAALCLQHPPRADAVSLWRSLGPWRAGGQMPSFSFELDGQQFGVTTRRHPDRRWSFKAGSETFDGMVEQIGQNQLVLRSGNHVSEYWVAVRADEVWLGWNGNTWRLMRPRAASLQSRREGGETGSASSVVAPMPGRVARVNVNEGDVVEPHQVLVVLEAMKMEHAIETPAGGVVRELHCREGDLVAAGAPLLELGESA
jgi:3-methylcrotonyl-CoA carboxylase alpha subunit